MPKGYSKCIKCGLLRHDEDGDVFRGIKDGYKTARKTEKNKKSMVFWNVILGDLTNEKLAMHRR